jgi:hypothetical protein
MRINRSVSRLVIRVAGLAALGMTATFAGAQAIEVKGKPPLYKYVSYWTIPRSHWAEVVKDDATGNQKILAPALADGTLVGYGHIACKVDDGTNRCRTLRVGGRTVSKRLGDFQMIYAMSSDVVE